MNWLFPSQLCCKCLLCRLFFHHIRYNIITGCLAISITWSFAPTPMVSADVPCDTAATARKCLKRNSNPRPRQPRLAPHQTSMQMQYTSYISSKRFEPTTTTTPPSTSSTSTLIQYMSYIGSNFTLRDVSHPNQ